jgi:hypothetical protein
MSQTDPDQQPDDDVQDVAEATSERIQPPDPYTEPPNSTVDDWFGQRVQRDADNAERGRDTTEQGRDNAE